MEFSLVVFGAKESLEAECYGAWPFRKVINQCFAGWIFPAELLKQVGYAQLW